MRAPPLLCFVLRLTAVHLRDSCIILVTGICGRQLWASLLFMVDVIFFILLSSSVALAGAVESHCFHNQTEYSHECALEAVRYASIAYLSNTEAILKWDCEECLLVPELDVLKLFQGHNKDSFGYVGVQKSDPYNLVLAFRGTTYTSESAAIADLEFTEIRWPSFVDESAVDHGFLNYYLSLESEVRNTLQEYLAENPDTPLLITGHSLGGAASLIAAVALHDLVPEPLIYTFGGPRVGNLYFARYLQSILPTRIYRVVHDHDIVAHLPPCSWIPWRRSCEGPKFPYHVPTEVLYDPDMNSFTLCSISNGEDPECSDRFSATSLSVSQHLVYFGFRVGLPIAVQTIVDPDYASVI